MARRPRLSIAGVPQHLIQRGNNRQATFFCDDDYGLYLECLEQAALKHGCLVHAYVLMTNHVHLLITPSTPDGNSLVMRDVGRRYVQYINYRYRRSGTLWEGRFKSSLVDSPRYFLACCRYIEFNPVRAGMVARPDEYRWSSHRHYARGDANRLLRRHAEYDELGSTDIERQQAYRDLFRHQVDERSLNDIREAANKGWPLGRDRFKDEIELALQRTAQAPKKGRPLKHAQSGA